MCGIAGFCNFNLNFEEKRPYWEKILVSMRESIAHRGYDQTGEYLKNNVGLSHTRLSIRDINGGAQPLIRNKNNNDYAIVYNGEIYNTDELKQALTAEGYIFTTTTDTEVILYAYMEYGKDFVKKLNGIYAFAIWDGQKSELNLYRDRLGVKPLFYTIHDNTLIFGSEIKAIFEHPEVTPKANLNSFREIIGIGPARTSGCGVFEDIFEVKPATVVTFCRDGLKEYCYWQLKADRHYNSYEETVEKVSFLVRDAIKRQLVSDVAVCSFLSGGIDSSIVTAVAATNLAKENVILNTFSFDFTGNDINFKSNAFQPEQDKPYVDKMLKQYRLNHTYLECDESQLVGSLYNSVIAKDLPGMTDIDGSLMCFCSLVKQKNKVALTGECADEIFGGYPWFYREDLLFADSFPWSKDITARYSLLNQNVIDKLDIKGYAREKYVESLKEVPMLDGENSEEKRRREVSFLNIRWFMQTLLDRMDRASMSCGLEARVPFADHRIVEYLYNVPWEMKYRNGVEKALLRDACSDLLSQELLHRKKSPYPKTYSPIYEKMLVETFNEILNDKNAPVKALLDINKTKQFLESPKNYGKPWFGQLMAAPQMIAYYIQINYWMKHFNLEFNA